MPKKISRAEMEQKRQTKIDELRKEFQNHLQKLMNDFATDLEGLKEIIDIDEEKWINDHLQKFDDEQLKIPTGKYKDVDHVFALYQQHFMEHVRQLCPEIIEELKQFTPQFDFLIGKSNGNYLQVFDELQGELLDDYFELENEPFGDDYSFYWGKLQNLLISLDENGVNEDLVNEDLLDESLSFFLDRQKINIEETKQKIIKAFQETATDKGMIVKNFTYLQLGLLNWAKKHFLEKDWIIEYTYYFLWQFCDAESHLLGPTLSPPDFAPMPSLHAKRVVETAEELEVGLKGFRCLEAHIFEFRVRGWRAGEEDKEEYEQRVTEYFREKMEKYFDIAYRDLGLDKKIKVTKPIDYSTVKWLVRWTVQGWSKEQILDEISQQDPNSRDLSTLGKAFEKFKEYDLPVRG
ncbi:MAG: hypothetical protein R2747_13595 [Pyrinomonadaceae bacterium]